MVDKPAKKISEKFGGSKGMRFGDSPLLGVDLPMWRSKLAVFLMFAAFMGLIARALYVQCIDTRFFQRQGEIRYQRNLELPATRGKIMDRNGQVLASSVPAKAVWVIPEDVKTNDPKLPELGRLLGMSVADIKKKLSENKNFVYLKRQVEPAVADKIAKLDVDGVEQRKEYKRYYPEGETVAHVVGFTNVEDLGQEGMELSLQSMLAGKTGARRVIKDRLGHVVEDVTDIVPPQDGRDMTLSIDSKIQFLAYTHLKNAVDENRAKAGGIIVLDAKTGEILALANLPTYNPNQRGQLNGAQLRNRVLTDTFEPGSTMKPFTVSLALDEHKVTPSTQIQTSPGKLTIGTATISDSHAHGILSVAQVIQKSSNIGTAKIALQMEPHDMWEMFTEVGFGQAPRIGFPGAVAGRLRPYKSWKTIEQVTMSYGYGISVSLFQLARAYTVFARDGELIPVSITKTDGPVAGSRVISPETAKAMRAMLEMVVSPEGTAPKAQIVGYRVGGKTGTAHKQEGNGYSNKYRGFFVGMAPMSDPRIICAVMIDEPSNGKYFGGDVAAPVFAQVMAGALRALNITPDAPFKTLVNVEGGVEESM
ncbi:peptidoglycan D,D-transpeptidase FtsI family protein [Ampullimonas aquatilis]|uniref:peptidoglycan D,D-transpeptidase FtsI family protein n=1 Tax=Ampullimonas aquatilis TaxID=1341549 RepID=UPI003C717904